MNTTAKVGCAALVGLMLLTGCLPSLNPAFKAENVVFDPAIVGEWTQAGGQATWNFSRKDNKTYGLLYTDKNGQQGRFVARLVDLQGTLFLDLCPEEIEAEASAFYKFHLVPIHTIFRVRSTEPRLTLSAIDYKWLETFLAENPDSIQYATFNGRRLVTASTDDVQALLMAHTDAFSGDFHLEKESSNID